MKAEKGKKENTEEPFEALETPAPPQVIEPNAKKEQEKKGPESQKRKSDEISEADTGRRLGESPTEIDDETTI